MRCVTQRSRTDTRTETTTDTEITTDAAVQLTFNNVGSVPDLASRSIGDPPVVGTGTRQCLVLVVRDA
jgi:hypothetical protein